MKTGAFSCCFMGLIYVLTAIMGMESRGYAPMRENGGLILADIADFYFPHGGAFLLAAIVFLACISSIFDLLRTLPAGWTSSAHLTGLLKFLGHYLPFFHVGFGWLVPTVIVLAGICIWKIK